MDSERRENHRCHAHFCMAHCEPERLMCMRHWRMVPPALQQDVWKHYREGQCEDMRPSSDWHKAADKAIRFVYDLEQEIYSPKDGRAPLHAITVRQPWATLIAHGVKDVENRDWSPHPALLGQYIAIHAGKSVDAQAWSEAASLAESQGLLDSDPLLRSFVFFGGHDVAKGKHKAGRALSQLMRSQTYGAIIALAKVAGCQSKEDCKSPWFMGPFAWNLESVVPIDPVPCSGSQGLWRPRDKDLVLVRNGFRRSLSSKAATTPASDENAR